MGSLEKEKLADLEYERRRVARDRDRILAFDPRESQSELFALQKNVLSSLPFDLDGCVLDYGAGTSEIGEWMALNGHRTIAVELSQELLSLSKERTARRQGPAPGYVIGDCEHLPLSAESVDVAVCWAILHHLPNPDLGAKELFRVVRPGGVCVLVEPNSLGPHRRVRQWLIRRKEGIMETSFYPWALRRIFSNAGFQVERASLAPFREDLKHRSRSREVVHRLANGRVCGSLNDMLLFARKL